MSSIIEELEDLRIDVEAATAYRDPTGILKQMYERANEMLDDAIQVVKDHMDLIGGSNG